MRRASLRFARLNFFPFASILQVSRTGFSVYRDEQASRSACSRGIRNHRRSRGSSRDPAALQSTVLPTRGAM